MRRRLGAVGILLNAVGILLIAFGLLFAGQGLGWVRWPASSFMIDARQWIGWGAALAVVGLIFLRLARRPRR